MLKSYSKCLFFVCEFGCNVKPLWKWTNRNFSPLVRIVKVGPEKMEVKIWVCLVGKVIGFDGKLDKHSQFVILSL